MILPGLLFSEGAFLLQLFPEYKLIIHPTQNQHPTNLNFYQSTIATTHPTSQGPQVILGIPWQLSVASLLAPICPLYSMMFPKSSELPERACKPKVLEIGVAS